MNVRGVVRSRMRMLRNAWKPPRRGGHPLIAPALAIAMAAIIGLGLSALFEALAREGVGASGAASWLAGALTATLIGLFVFDVHHAVASLLVDSDLDRLRLAPMRPGAMLVLKLVDALPRTMMLVVVLALPAVLAYIDHFPIPPWGLPLVALQLIALWAIPLGLGVAGSMLLLHAVPSERAREALGLISTLTLVVLWLANGFLIPELLESSEGPAWLHSGPASIGAALAILSPGHAVALALASAHDGTLVAAGGWSVWTLALGAASLALAGLAVTTRLGSLQARLGSRQTSRRRQPRAAALPARRSLVRAILRRDARMFLRDWTVLGDVLTAALLWTLLPLLTTSGINAPAEFIARVMLLALTVGLGYEIGARTIPFERRGLAWPRLAPIATERWVAAKFIGALVISLPLLAVAGIAIFLVFPLGLRAALPALSTAFAALVVALTLGLWTGLKFGDPEWTNPRAMITTGGRILASGLLLAQAAAWLVLGAMLGRLPWSGRAYLDVWVPILVAACVGWGLIGATARGLRGREHLY